MKGSYFLVIKLDEEKTIRTKGKTFELLPGYYVYVGSAMNSLEKRVRRHFSREKKLHWHIDYLLKEARLLRAYLIPSEERPEDTRTIGDTKHGKHAPLLGASDVNVATNLYHFDEEPDGVLIDILKNLGLSWKTVKSVREM
ncbi:DUF123 domain-containing protein [Thermococcus sp.]|uniref:GIY-YIG nuclease family protein n=1 Tax=Thermococcus sp. TaxID=35749 RepID=UPI002616341E|nr:DUF123 domain-containing protein [Thermococcus sp.]